jgi:hypothetical protein
MGVGALFSDKEGRATIRGGGQIWVKRIFCTRWSTNGSHEDYGKYKSYKVLK